MAATYDFTQTTYVVMYGTHPDSNRFIVIFKKYTANTQLTAADYFTVEQFTDEQAALNRATELGYEPEEEEPGLID